MKHHRIYFAVAALVLATLACQTVMGGGASDVDNAPPATDNITQPQEVQPTEPPTELPAPDNNTGGSDSTVSSNFPMTADAYNIVEVGEDNVIYYTKLSAEEALQFYRDEYAARGYTEREILTSVSDGIFSIVFDGDPSGKAVVIQSVDLGDGSRTISIRLEDV